jgi:hypothetical protein
MLLNIMRKCVSLCDADLAKGAGPAARMRKKINHQGTANLPRSRGGTEKAREPKAKSRVIKASETSPSTRKWRAAVPMQTPAVRFPEVQGKTLEWVELWLDDEDRYIELSFQDKTALLFEIQPYGGFHVLAAYGDWKTKNWREIKRWTPVST